MQFVATCLFGLEKYLGDEIEALGLRKLETMDGRVTFEGEPIDCARANIGLRTAERVLIKVGSFPATDFSMLFDGTKALPWETFIGENDAFPVRGHSIRSGLTSLPDCQSIIKKAVVSRLQEFYTYDIFPETGAKYQIEFFLFKDVVTLMIDTSGEPLHKRGYRPASGGAPLRETLAAAMVMNARLSEDILLWDPFCGSGTILIEAVLYMNRIAPGLDRSFSGEQLACLPPELWEKARAEAEAEIRYDSAFEAWGSDLDEEVLGIAKENALRAGVLDQIKFFRADARGIRKPEGRKGTILTNPPYGERLLTVDEAEELYRAIGRNFSYFAPWQIYVLTMSETFERAYGRRADRVRKLYNGMIPCNLYQYYLPDAARVERGIERGKGGYHPFDRPKDKGRGGAVPRGGYDRSDKGNRYDKSDRYDRSSRDDRKSYGGREERAPRGEKSYVRGNQGQTDRGNGGKPRDVRGGDPKRTQVWRERNEREIPVRYMNPQKRNASAGETEPQNDDKKD